MFGKLFGGKDAARRGEDKVWTTDAARQAGLMRDAAQYLEGPASVIVVAQDRNTLDSLTRALADRQPEVSTDVFSKESLQTALRDRCKLTLALASALQPGTKIDAGHDVHVLVHGRHPLRAQDDAICRFADAQGSRMRVTFYLALDDALLAKHAQGILPILEKLGLKPDEAIESGMVSRAIANAQDKNNK